ncbi:MAG: KUP/HAK/KT family potassium transporter [Cyanobacteriota bacterium]
MSENINDSKQVIKSIGLVFGDIGTSPIYTLTIAFMTLQATHTNVLGIVSLVIWTLILLVFIKYAWLAMSLGVKGEGGTIVLRETLMGMFKSPRSKVFVTFLTFVGISLLIGDGVITPAISLLSAVEGFLVLPAFQGTPQYILILLAIIIAIMLFSFQKNGTDKVAKTFGPIMIVWFLVLGLSGIMSILKYPDILWALSPYYALEFFFENGIHAFFSLSIVFLCATGSEALFADMGHLGHKPIITAWYFVFVALVLNYLGQGAYLLHNSDANFVLFEMVYNIASITYIPFLLLCVVATIIASQAMISGMFSIVFQAIRTRIMPMFKIDYTSPHLRSQIYIGTVNWFLLVCVIFIILIFKESKHLGAAYGLAVAGDMAITGFLMILIFYFKKNYIKLIAASLLIFVDITFLMANTTKIHLGGYWSILISLIPLILIIIYNIGNRRVYKALRPMALKKFLDQYNDIYQHEKKIKGTAIFFIRDISFIPPYIPLIFFTNNIIYQDNVFVSIINTNDPFGVKSSFKQPQSSGLRVFEVEAGYMEMINLEEILRKASINPKVIFYGIEEIVTTNISMKIFSIIKKLAPSFVQFYKLPSNKVHGVITRLDI